MGTAKPFSLLAKPIQRALKEREFHHPTEPQAKSIPLIMAGRNVLLIAPTGTGKTEAAILPVLSLHIESRDRTPGIRILYITPLRALNRDLLERLEWWCERMDVKVAVRHGDTEVVERSRQARSPPDLLITTPETLQAIMTGRLMKNHLRQVRWLIVDEVHELAEDKRGSQLSLALERLRWITMRDFQVVGLSATIGTPEIVAKFLVGENREAEVVHVPVAREMRLQILFPKPRPRDEELSMKLYTHPEVASRLMVIRSLIKKHDTVLLFTNTRSIAEVLASRFKIWDIDFPISIHHGSLAKAARITAERGLKSGALKGLVSTSSLELGIDVGRIDFVIQYMSPRQVTRLIQRVGRSGHSIGRIADGAIVTMDSDDTLESLVIARRAYEENLEAVTIPYKPLDVLAHQVAGLLIQKRKWQFQEILDLFRSAHPYRDLTEEELAAVITYMHTRFPRFAWASFQDKVVLRPQRIKELYRYYFEKLSMIPDEKQYLVVDQSTDTPVGVLDEAFVAEYGEPGTKFIVRGTPWKMVSIHGDKIYVRPIKDPSSAIPSWVGEEIPVPFQIAQEVGAIRAYVAESVRSGSTRREISRKLADKYPAEAETVLRALTETFQQLEAGLDVPTDRVVTVEDWEDYVIVNAHFGLLVNRTLARLIGHILSEETGYTVGVQQDPYRIVIQTLGAGDSDQVVDIIQTLAKKDVKDVVSKASMKTGLFKRRLVHVARRFGAISRWVDFSNLKLNQLMKSFEGTVIMEEALKETLEKDLDVPNTQLALQGVRDGEIRLVRMQTDGEATPIARIGIERISRKTDLIPPEKIKRILLESTKARILNEVKTFACPSCWQFVVMMKIGDLTKQLKCPKCGSRTMGILSLADEELRRLQEKKGRQLSGREKDIAERAMETGALYEKFGNIVAYILAGKRLDTADVENILHRERRISDRLFELIMEAEREALRERFF